MKFIIFDGREMSGRGRGLHVSQKIKERDKNINTVAWHKL